MPSSKTQPIGNLPAQLSSFIGRTREIEEVKELISVHRLVTLTGAGGSGKTRLALQVANELQMEYKDGVWLAELASLSDDTLVTQSIASHLNIREQPGRPLIDILADHLFSRHSLLVIDNCEHLINACAKFAELILQRCPNLRILTTSREMLGINGESVWAIPPLTIPEEKPWKGPASDQNALNVYRRSEAVQLFVKRAASIVQGFDLKTENAAWVSEICRRLDGMPLAIELAAARVRSLSVQQIAERLDDRFHLLTAGSRTRPPRQQTLAATLDWSYNLLSPIEQKVLERLSVFANGATMEAIEAVCAGEGVESAEVLDTLSNLVNKSLVTTSQSEHGEIRYGQLETIQQYALERLKESGDEVSARDRHLLYVVELAEKVEPHLEGRDQLEWLDRFEIEHDNFRTALEWSRTSESRVDSGLRLAAGLGLFWIARGYFSEGRAQLSAVLAIPGASKPTLARAKALLRAADLSFNLTDYPVARAQVEESIKIYRELGSAGRLGLAHSLIELGDLLRELGSYEKAWSLLEEALGIMQELNDLLGRITALWQLGYCALSSGDYSRAEQYYEEVLPMSRQNGDDLTTSIILSGLAETALRKEDFGRASLFEEESLLLRRKTGDKWGIAVSNGNFGWIALRQGDFAKAAKLLLESLTIRREIEDRGGIAWCLEKLAKLNILIVEKKYRTEPIEYLKRAAHLFSAATALRTPVGSVVDLADRLELDHDIEAVQNGLGNELFATFWAEGKSMALETVIQEASEESAKESLQSEKEKFGGLTAREREVAILVSQGRSNREIAEIMTVGIKTVETYITRILDKLSFDSRVQIAAWMIGKAFKDKESR